MPFLDLEVLAKTFEVFHQIPCRIFFQARTPIITKSLAERFIVAGARAGFVHARSRFSGSSLIQENDLSDTDDERTCQRRHGFGREKNRTDLVLMWVEEAAIFLIASSAGATCTAVMRR